MPPALSIYQNQANKQAELRELSFQPINVPTALPCFTVFPGRCKMGMKFKAFAFPRGSLQFIGFYDDVAAIHDCLSIGNSYAGEICQCWTLVKGGDQVVDGKIRGRIFLTFRIPDYFALRGRKRPGTTARYIW